MSLERVIIYLEAYAYDVCASHRQVIALWVANEAISAGDENSSFLEEELMYMYVSRAPGALGVTPEKKILSNNTPSFTY